jgi:hypothetical protein
VRLDEQTDSGVRPVFVLLWVTAALVGGCGAPETLDTAAETADTTEEQRSGIEVDRSAFRASDEGFTDGEVIIVSGADTALAVAAFEAASIRLMLVDQEGIEYNPENEGRDFGDEPTPSYVSPIEVNGDEVSMYVDCKGVIPAAQREVFVAIMVEELEAQGISTARLYSPPKEQ